MTPRLDPRWPPVLETVSRMSLRMSAARAGSSSGASFLMSLVALIRWRTLISMLSGEDEIRDLAEPLTFYPHKTDSRLGGGNFLGRKSLGLLEPVDAGDVPASFFGGI